ncbi:MAG: alpha/beta hydrolase [Pseudomonadota bacterium]
MLAVGDAVLETVYFGPSPTEAPTIVLLHEGLGCCVLWRDFPHRLAALTGCGVFAYSRAGYGRSSPAHLPRPTDYMTQEAIDVLPRVLDAIGLQRGILLGHSDGATIAAIHGGSVPDPRVHGLILLAPHFFTEPEGLSAIAEAGQSYRATDLRDRLAKYHDDPDISFLGWHDVWLSTEFRAWSVAHVIDEWRVPVLALQGQDDQYGTLAQIHEIERRIRTPLETCILERCGHAPHLEATEATLDAITGFITRVAPGDDRPAEARR